MKQLCHPLDESPPKGAEQPAAVNDELAARLETRVKERTAELAAANAELTRELADLRQVEEILWQSNEKFQRTEALLQRKTMFLQLLQEVTVAANEAASLEKALQVCLDRVCGYIGWPIGHVYHFPTDASGELTPSTLWHFPVRQRFEKFKQDTQGLRFLPGSGLPGRVLASGKPAWIKDVTEEAGFPRADLAKQLGIRAALAFPVLVGKEVAAVLEFFATDTLEPDEALLEVMANIGTQLGRVIERTRAAEALRQSELRFRSVAESAFEAIISANSDGHIIYWNKAAERIFGYTDAEVLGQPLVLLMPPHYGDAHKNGLERLKNTGEARVIGKTVELHGLRKGGDEFPLELSLSSWKTADGTFYTGIIRDITERKRAQEAILLYAELVKGVKDYAIYMLDPQGQVLTWNAGAERITGYRAEEVVGRHLSQFYPRNAMEQGWPEQELKRAADDGRFEDEGWRVHKDGAKFWANVVVTALRDDAGKLIGFSKITRDLTERMLASEAVKVSEQRLNLALDSAEMGAWDLDLVHDTAVRNLRHDQIFGYPALQPQWGYELFLAHVVPEDRDLVKKCFFEHAVSTGHFSLECRIRWPDNSLHWIAAQGRVFRNDRDEPIRMLGVVTDITERKRAEQEILQSSSRLEAANKELEAFSYSVSHDLRAPLRAMAGFSRILAQQHAAHLPAEACHYLQLICDNAKGMGQLIDDLLNFSRLGRQPLKKQSVAPADLARQVLADLRREPEGRCVEITLGELPLCQADPGLLKQVFANLLDNALKYTGQRDKAVIEVGCRVGGGNAGEAVYFVKDNGVGFDMRYAHKLFGVFQRLHRAEDYEGTGVGLAIVARIVRRHGGRIWAEAEVDKGATFYFTLGNGTCHD